MTAHQNYPLLAAAGLCTLALTQQACADSGTFESVYAFVSNYTTFEHFNVTITGGSNRGTSTFINASGAPFVKGQSSTQECVVLGKKGTAGLTLESDCTITDPSGDKVYMQALRKSGEMSQGSGLGTARLLGGTGKYTGITGDCTYTVQYFSDNRAVSPIKCQWQKL